MEDAARDVEVANWAERREDGPENFDEDGEEVWTEDEVLKRQRFSNLQIISHNKK